MSDNLKYKKYSGLQIICRKCKKQIHNNSSHKNCSHPIEKQSYKAVITVPNSGGKRKTKILSARTYDQAVIELIEFKNSVLNGDLENQNKKSSLPSILRNCVVMYIDYLSDIDVPAHEKKHNTKKHIHHQMSIYKMFFKFLKQQNKDIDNYKINDIDDNTVGEFHTYLLNNYSNSTYNHSMKAMKTLFKFFIKKGANLKNPFENVKLRYVKSKNETINSKDFYDLIDVIKPTDSIKLIGKTKRNMYKEWLVDVIKLKAYTGRRDEEIATMKWNWIRFDENNNPIYIKCPNIKVNKKHNSIKKEEFEYNYIPIAQELKELLNDLKLEDNKNTDNYIIAPNIKNRKTLINQASKSFTFFFNKLKRDYKKEFNYLRKTYITRLKLFDMHSSSLLSNEHSNISITNKHYINYKETAEFLIKNNFRIFENKKKGETTLTNNTFEKTKGSAIMQNLDYQSGEYRNRTDDLLTASQTL